MRDDMDIEETLKRFESDPSPKVKRSIMARFSRRFGSRRLVSQKTLFWKKPVPLYVATVGIVVAVALSFIAGRRGAAPEVGPGSLLEPGRALNAGTTPELKWEAAPNDLL